MAYEVVLRPSAQRVLNKFTPPLRQRILEGIRTLELNPRPPGCKKLKGGLELYRIRIGDYRVVYSIEDGVLRVLVVTIGHRGSVYE